MDYGPYLETARAAAQAASGVIMRHYQAHLRAPDDAAIGLSIKADETPVTCADREAEQAIRGILEDAFPGHDFYGEETGRTDSGSEYLWLVDPLDGTRSFVRRYPFFSTQIALMHRGEVVVGVSSAPVFDETAWAVRGGGAFLDGEPLAVSGLEDLAAGTLSTGNLASLAGSDGWAGLGELVRQVARNRGYGDFYHYHLLAAGKIDLVIESDVNVLDVAALSLIVEESGGRFSDLNGAALSLETSSVLAGTPALWELARTIL